MNLWNINVGSVKIIMKSPLMQSLVVTVAMMVSSMTLLKKKVRKNKMDLTCPNCNREIMFDDEFTNFEDGGDYIIATATYICPECGDVMTVRATFAWDGNLEVE